MSTQDIKEVVKEKYGQAALKVTSGASVSCCSTGPAEMHCADPITSKLYDAIQVGQLPDTAVLASLGCGNPTALAELKPGTRVVSHRFSMPDWEPVKTIEVDSRTIYLWIIPEKGKQKQ